MGEGGKEVGEGGKEVGLGKRRSGREGREWMGWEGGRGMAWFHLKNFLSCPSGAANESLPPRTDLLRSCRHSPPSPPALPSAEGGSCRSCSPRPGGASACAGSAVSAVSGADPAGGFGGSPLAPSTRWRQHRDSSHATLCHHATHLLSPPPSPSPAIHPTPRER